MKDEGNKKSSARDLFINSWRTLKLIYSWKETRTVFVFYIIALILAAAVPFLNSGANALLINELVGIFGSGEFTQKVLILIAVLFVAGLLSITAHELRNYLERIFDLNTKIKAEALIMEKHAEIDISTKERPEMNDLFQKSTENMHRLGNFTRRQFWIIESAIIAVVAIAIITVVEWWMLIIIIAATIPSLINEARHGSVMFRIHTEKAEARRRFHYLRAHFTNISDIIELKIFQNTKFFLKKALEFLTDITKEEQAGERKRFSADMVSSMLEELTLVGASVWFIYLVIKGEMQIGTFTFMVSSITRLQQSMGAFFRHLGRQFHDGLYVTDFYKFLDIKQEIHKLKNGHVLPKNKTPEIVFDNVSFAYPGTSKMVLKNFNLTISPGQKVALIGVNGAGKTTFVKLLARFYDPTEGNIYVDGKNLKEIDLDSWYNQLGILFQDYAKYHFLVRDSISIGRTSVKEKIEKVKESAVAAEADIFIDEWEKNYNQMLGRQFSEGVEPSIGQWQKLGLARTFYREPRVLILDEPTSSVDAEAEAKIFEKLEKLPNDRSVILISHRFSTVRQANKIVVIESGENFEEGAHEELLKLQGTYSRLFNLQAKGYR